MLIYRAEISCVVKYNDVMKYKFENEERFFLTDPLILSINLTKYRK